MAIRKHLAALAVIAALTALMATPAFALLVQPIAIDLSTVNAGSSAGITVTNDRNRPSTIEVTINSLTLPEQGPPVLTPDKGDDFLVFPPASTILPSKTQVFRLRWIGDPKLAQSKVYMFSISELPVDQLKGSGVQVLYSIQSLVTVTSPDLKPDTHVVKVMRDTRTKPGEDGKPATVTPGVSIEFANAGNAIDYVSRYKVTFSIDGKPDWSEAFDAPDVTKSVGLGLLTPDSKRILFFPMTDVPASGTIRASIEDTSKN